LERKLDKIHVRDLLLRTIIGINPDERENRQDVVINLTLYTDVSRADEFDAITDVVDYRKVTKRVIAHVESSEFNLVEKLALSIARIVLAEFSVERIRVSVEKPGALRFARTVGVEIERERADFL
jgi:FolB domain-containing protein